MAKKKASKKKVKAKQVSQVKSKGSIVKEVLVAAPDDVDQEPVAAPAHATEPMCYSRSKASKAVDQVSGQTQHMTVAEHNKLRAKGK